MVKSLSFILSIMRNYCKGKKEMKVMICFVFKRFFFWLVNAVGRGEEQKSGDLLRRLRIVVQGRDKRELGQSGGQRQVDKINRIVVNIEDRGFKGLVSVKCLYEIDQGGGKGNKQFCFGQVYFGMLVSLLRGNISRYLVMQNGDDQYYVEWR